MTTRARYATALRRSRLVLGEREPDTLGALAGIFTELSTEREPTIVMGAGRDGSARPDAPCVIVHTRALPRRISLDAHSGVAQVSAWSTWSDVEREARQAGWTVSHLQDADPDATVGGTLARASLLPPLWMSQTSASACVGAEAISGTGERYSYADAPRTSSGPDWRTLWFGSEGRGGALTQVTVELAREMPVSEHRVAARRVSARRLRQTLEPFLNIAQLAPASADAWRVRVRGDSHRAALIRARLSAAGFADVPAEAVGWPDKALLVAAPWSHVNVLRGLELPQGAEWQAWASGPTHILWMLTAERAGASELVDVAKRSLELPGSELIRVAFRGILRPARTTSWLPRDVCGGRRT